MSDHPHQKSSTPPHPKETLPEKLLQWKLGHWSFYFLIKIILAFRGLLILDPINNLLLVFFIAIPIPVKELNYLRKITAVIAAIALLYHDSWLPPIHALWSKIHSLSDFNGSYLLELAGRVIEVKALLLLLLLWVVYFILYKRVRVGTLIGLALAFFSIQSLFIGNPLNNHHQQIAVNQDNNSSGNTLASTVEVNDSILNYQTSNFFSKELGRFIGFNKLDPKSTPFDILIIHICSLSWDDMKTVGLDQHPFWTQSDVLFTRFNSVSTYSGPAAIRLMRAPCGQESHEGLYSGSPDACYLMSNLTKSDFTPQLALNHNGKYDDFLKQVQAQNFPQTPFTYSGLNPALMAFDNSPIYDDFDVLNSWWNYRTSQLSDKKNVALYYNTITLHDGNRYVGHPGESSLKTFKPRLEKLLNDLVAFRTKLMNSNRNVLLIVVPEHGAALRGDSKQISGLREIPTPAITLVPVSLTLIGPQIKHSDIPKVLAKPMSFLALTQTIQNSIAHDLFINQENNIDSLTHDLPLTEFLAQNSENIMLRFQQNYYLSQGQNTPWTLYSN
jgi:cellulose synthase operon protein YhjU